MTLPTLPDPFSAILMGVAGNIASDLIKAGSARLAKAAFGDAEQQALQRAYQQAIIKTLTKTMPELDDRRLKHLEYLLKQFVQDPEVTDALIDCALSDRQPELADLETKFESLFDSSAIPVSFSNLMSGFVSGLEEELLAEAARPESPIANRVNLGQLTALRAQMAEGRGEWAESLRILKKLDNESQNRMQSYPASLAALASEYDELVTRWAGAVERDLEQMRTALREGREAETLDWVSRIKEDRKNWSILTPAVKAKILLLEAGLELDITRNVARAKELADEAKVLAPEENQVRLRAHIARRDSGTEAALSLLNGYEDVDSINLRAAFLLDMGHVAKCQALLNPESRTFEPHAETHRVRALACFLGKDLTQARLEIAKALELEPRWESVRFASAVIGYHSALSPAALPNELPPWPEPIDWAFVRKDNESIAHLREAEKAFHVLTKGCSVARGQQQEGKAWRLACLANDPERQEQATEYCRELLAADNTYWPAIAWASARNYNVDLGPSRDVIEKRIVDGTSTLPQILVLVASYLRPGSIEKALDLLRQSKPVFVKQKAELLWTIWQVQALLAGKDTGAALKTIEEFGMVPELRDLHAMAITASAHARKDWQPAIDDLEQGLAETQDPRFLFQACELMARQEKWEYVADRAERLVGEIETDAALHLGAIAAFRSHRLALCLTLLDRYSHLYNDRRLPGELRRVRVLAQQGLGILPKAVQDAEALVNDEPSERNLVALAELYYAQGDLKRLAILAPRFLEDRPLRAETLLHVAQLVHTEDRQAAKELWRKALTQPLPDSGVLPALDLGFRLGLDHELASLVARMMQLGSAGHPGVEILEFEEIASRIKKQREGIIEINELYWRGEVPIHAMAATVGSSMATLFHSQLADNEGLLDLSRQPSILARHAGRGLESGFPSEPPRWHLHLDITALLLAAHLGALPAVESAFKPLRISAELPIALVDMRKALAPHQLSQLQALEQIVDLADRGLVKSEDLKTSPDVESANLVKELGGDWVALYEGAKANHGYILCFLPPTRVGQIVPPSTMPTNSDQYLVNCRAVVDSLRAYGPLSDGEYADAIQKLGTEGGKAVSAIVPRQGSLLYCFANTPHVLANIGLLEVVCRRFQVRIQTNQLNQVRAALKHHARTDEAVHWLDELRERISRGIEAGTYQILPPGELRSKETEETTALSPELRCLQDLLIFKPQEGDVIWVDDRFVNGYTHRDGTPIIGISEILKALVAVNSITADEYYSTLIKLRASNVLFIPVQTDEILYYLQQARIDGSRIVETKALQTLRRYVNACLLKGGLLEKPQAAGPNKNGESEWFLSLNRAILDAILGVWAKAELDEKTRKARSQWILDSLYLDLDAQLRVLDWPRPAQATRYRLTLSLTALIGLAIQLLPESRRDNYSRSRGYLEWLDAELLQQQFASDPSLPAAVAHALKTVLMQDRERLGSNNERLAHSYLLQQLYEDLPEAIRNELWRDTDFMSIIGIEPLLGVTAHGLNFRREDFFRAVARAINGHEGRITPIESKQELIFQPRRDGDGRPTVTFQDPATGEYRTIEGPEVQLLTDSVTERERVLRANRYWIDCPRRMLDRVVAEIASLKDPMCRLEVFDSWHKSSATSYYTKLRDQIRERRAYAFDDLFPPNLDGLIRFLRISLPIVPDDDLFQALSGAAETLVKEEGLAAAIIRFAGLPVPLPNTIIDELNRLDPLEARSLTKILIRMPGSPVSGIHLVRILTSLGAKSPAMTRLARRIARALLSADAAEEMNAFLAMLRWTDNQFDVRPSARTCPTHLRLALTWSHTHQLFTVFASARVALDRVTETFGHAAKQPHPRMFKRDFALRFDVAHPSRVEGTNVLIMGLAYGLGTSERIRSDLQELSCQRAFVVTAGLQLPTWSMLHDTSFTKDSLGSFLGGDREPKLAALLGEEAAARFSGSYALEQLRTVIHALDEDANEALGWQLLFAILGDLPAPDELAGQLKSVLLKTKYASLYRRSPQLGYLALHTAALQGINLCDEELRSHLKAELRNVAAVLTAQENDADAQASPLADSEKQSETYQMLLQLALDIALASPNPDNVIIEFKDIVGQLIEVLRSMIPATEIIIRRLCDGLPRDQAQHLWTLHVRLRAS